MRSLPFGRKLVVTLGLSLFSCTLASPQMINLSEGRVRVVTHMDLPAKSSSLINQQADANAVTPGLQFYTANYLALGSTQLPFNIVGSDPSLGANTTTIPTVLVPLKFVFPNSGNPTLDGSNVVERTQNSPIFQSANYVSGSVDLGVTQYGDALQRAQFWNLPGFSPDYHVLLGGPAIAAPITITLPAGKGSAYPLSGGGFTGVVDTAYFDGLLNALMANYLADQLPIFLTDNVFLGDNGLMQNCCILGFHASTGPPAATAKTWIYASYAEPGTFLGSEFGAADSDVVALSHEVAEWLNDPFVGSGAFGFVNYVPPAVLPGQGGACIFNFETGDPLEAPTLVFTKVTNSTTYHLQDEVFLPWYLHTVPSFSANGWYTFQNLSATIPLVVNSPATISGSYADTATLLFAPVDKPVTGDVAYVGRGCPAGSFTPGSAADPYLSDPNGKIALIDRGACGVSLKVDAAIRAGAIGVLIGLVAPGDPISFSYVGGSAFAPSLVITQATSDAIKASLASTIVNATLSPQNAIPASFSSLCGPG